MNQSKIKKQIVELLNNVDDAELLIMIKNLLSYIEFANKPVEEE